MNTASSSIAPASLPGPRTGITAGVLGNGLVMIALLGLAVALARWQVEAWQGPVLRTHTLMAAAAVIAAYAGFIRLTGSTRDRAKATTAAVATTDGSGSGDWLVVYASQFGQAESLAERTASSLEQTGQSVQLVDIANLEPSMLHSARQALFIASTTGEGDAPDPAFNFVRDCVSAADTRLKGLRYGILALGDSDYQQFCAFGHQIDEWLRSTGAEPLFDLVEVDDGDPGALRHWQYLLGELCGAADQPDWEAPAYRPWTLDTRRHLNAGSPGGPVYEVCLKPENPADLHWQAGDIAEIGPRQGHATVAAWLDATGLIGSSLVTHEDSRRGSHSLPLSQLLASSRLPAPDTMRGRSAQDVADELQALPHRAYSIASVPAEGCLRLLVRQVQHGDGALGLGSGWLTAHSDAPGNLDLRIRRNPAFHAPSDDRPLILIGNGTGVAGLRALLQERISAGHHRNWLLFGERSIAHDDHYGDEINAWQRIGALERLDVAFSRDQPAARYVQHLVSERSDELRQWLDQGAVVYVCGSLKGMAPAVDAALAAIVGGETLEAMAMDGRYRRDVY